jgi:hypothetical protein
MVMGFRGDAMKLSFSTVLFFTVSFFMVHILNAEIVTEATIGGGYQSNLFNDSNSIGDQYATFGANSKYYPSASVRFSVVAQYNAFATYEDLSNVVGETSVFYIPTSEASALTLAFGGSLSMRKFGAIYELYDHNGSSITADIGYRLSQRTFLKSSISFLYNHYMNSDYGSYRSIDLSTGLNATVMGSNAIALTLDYSRRSFDQPTLIQDGTGNSLLAGPDKTGTFDVTGIVVRFSRPLGLRTGMNLAIGHRQLHVGNNFTVAGYTIDYLSPWAELWEGTSLSGNVKHFFPNQWIAELSMAYFDKDYVDVVDLSDGDGETYWRVARSDQLATLSFSISRPISLHGGKTITPSVFLGYRQNQSTAEFFDHEDVAVSIALRIAL